MMGALHLVWGRAASNLPVIALFVEALPLIGGRVADRNLLVIAMLVEALPLIGGRVARILPVIALLVSKTMKEALPLA